VFSVNSLREKECEQTFDLGKKLGAMSLPEQVVLFEGHENHQTASQ
jgi:hypothetical protein